MFSKASDRTKRRTTEALRSAVEVEVLTHAAQVKLRSCWKRDASQVLKDISMAPKRATKYKRAFTMRQQDEKAQTKMTSVSALAIFVEAGLSRRQYEIIRSTHNIYEYILATVFYKRQNKDVPKPGCGNTNDGIRILGLEG